MSKYSDFVKSYMAKHGKTWNCAVCEIKKSGAYETYKKGGTEKKTVSASRKVSMPVQPNVEQASQVKTIAPSPIPAAAPLVEKPVIRQSRPLVMPELLGAMIQDFARPSQTYFTEKQRRDTLIRLKTLHDEYLSLHKKKYTNTIQKKLTKVENEFVPLVKPILKKELENGYFIQGNYRDSEGKMEDKKIFFNLVTERQFIGSMTYLQFKDENGKVIESLTKNGRTNSNTDPYTELRKALLERYKWRLFGNIAGTRDDDDFREFVGDLFPGS